MGNNSNKIGIFDSGVGGISVLNPIRQQYQNIPIIYVADQSHVPYGPRNVDEIRSFSEGISRFLISRNSTLIVIACNTASAAALKYLRQKFPEIPFVGMEPAVKPAAENTISGIVGVLATPATLQGALYSSVVQRFAAGVTVLQDTCPGLVSCIERGELSSPETEAILSRALLPMLEKGIDTVVLGCTHYPFVIPLIRKIAGPEIRIIDPAPAIAKQVGRLINYETVSEPGSDPKLEYFTTGNSAEMKQLLPKLIGSDGVVQELVWAGDELLIK